MTKNKQITLDNLTSALKAVYAQNTGTPLLIFRHWAARNYDIAQAAPDLVREIEDSFLETYQATKPLQRSEALDLLNVYGEHFYETAEPEERAALALAAGYTPLEYAIMSEGFSLRELMQALRALEAYGHSAPEGMLVEFFERYLCEWLGQKELIIKMPQIIEQYRREPAMESKERAKAILKAFGVRLLDTRHAKMEDDFRHQGTLTRLPLSMWSRTLSDARCRKGAVKKSRTTPWTKMLRYDSRI